jgi:ribosomal-protein-alanine N-acetyltransferase
MLPHLLHTDRLTLRPLTTADAPAIFAEYAQDPEASRFMAWHPHKSLGESEAFVSQSLAADPAQARTYVIAGRKDTALRGVLGLTQLKPHHVEFGYVLARPWWGKGLMSEALVAVVDWLLAQPENFRISGFCDVANTGSARVMEKAGLAREGMLRRWVVHPAISEEPRDCLHYAKVR